MVNLIESYISMTITHQPILFKQIIAQSDSVHAISNSFFILEDSIWFKKAFKQYERRVYKGQIFKHPKPKKPIRFYNLVAQ